MPPPSKWPFVICAGALFLSLARFPFSAAVRITLAVIGGVIFLVRRGRMGVGRDGECLPADETARGAFLMAVATMQHEVGPHTRHQAGHDGMYIFLASEVCSFGSLFATYFYLYGSHNRLARRAIEHSRVYVNWWPIRRSTRRAVLMLSPFISQATPWHTANRRRFSLFDRHDSFRTGIRFGQLYEFIAAFARGMTLTATASQHFFVMTGFHGAHVLVV